MQPAPPSPPVGPSRIATDGRRLHDSVTGHTFLPRGANYVRLGTVNGHEFHYGAADFLDIHLYPNANPWDAAGDLDTVERRLLRKLYVVGEMGARKAVYGGNLATATTGMRDAQRATCRLGAQGWLQWTWDTHEQLANQPLFFHMDEGGWLIANALAPLNRPDPCA